MHSLMILGIFSILSGASGVPVPQTANDKPYQEMKRCDVGIVGGGISGLYMAFEILTEDKDAKVCIFEKDDEVGGRIRDHRFEEAPDIDVGLGAWRVDHNQFLMIDFLNELNITYKDWSFVEPTLYESREIVSNNTKDIKIAYPALKNHPKFAGFTKADFWNYILKPENLDRLDKYASVFTYASDLITSEGVNYLSNFQFHRGDFEELVDPVSYFEFVKEESTLTGKYYRPHGGMSAIIETLLSKVKCLGGHIYLNTEVTAIFKRGRSRYIVRTPRLNAIVKKLVIAVPPGPFRKVRGGVARKIQKTAEFDSILPIEAFKGGAVYKEPWWEKVKVNNMSIKAGQQFISQDNCIGASLAHRGYGKNGEGVLHTIYTDSQCARRWYGISKLKKDYIDEEVHRALEAKYGCEIPKPIKTEYQYWDPAWHFQKSGTPFSMADIGEWAKRPFKQENIFVVGESYNPRRGWCEGAILSCRHALKEGWGIERDVGRKVVKKEIIVDDSFDVL